ncbi:hypothetical protein HZP20_03035 [Elizabethkingia anophelis]|nr:hypothetical protein [Elizabethkingia anophelis]
MNLAHYLVGGIIVPSIYAENKNTDIQDRFKNQILLCSSRYTKETNCAIEVIFNTDEEAPKRISENFYLFDMPLPISRIKSICFIHEEQKRVTAFNITSGAAFIPERLLEVVKDINIDTKELDNFEYKSSEKDWTEFLKRYDKILGGFSTMKISKEYFQNYPTHYFSTLGNINSLFRNILEKQNINIENIFQFAFVDESKFRDLHNTIYSEINYNEVRRYAEKDNVNLEIKNDIIQIDKIPENTQTYLVAIINSYGKDKRKQVDSFISDLVSGKFNVKRKEGLSLFFGLNKGYKAFRNKYKTTNFEVDIKFRLDSKLDYYIIESIYQNIFNRLDNISIFKYIDDMNIENVQQNIEAKKDYITYQMIDKTVVWKPKTLSPIEKILDKIVQRVSDWFPSFIEVKKNDIESLFKEDLLIFKNSIEAELTDKFRIELEQRNIYINNLVNTIEEKEIKINRLENQIKNNSQSRIESEKLSKKERIIYLHKNQHSNNQEDLVQEDGGALFKYDDGIMTEEQLKKLPMSALKKKAKELQIPKYSTYKNAIGLITEILKLTSRQ